ncbi:MAG TPA: hypothetical protein VIG66_09920 [Noviherbaspirillum sp.]
MNLHQQSALMIRSLLAQMRGGVTEHIVFPQGRPAISSEELLEMLEAPKVGDGMPDAALAIAEHAFRAGYRRCAVNFDEKYTDEDQAYHLENEAWDAYDPPEYIKELS